VEIRSPTRCTVRHRLLRGRRSDPGRTSERFAGRLSWRAPGRRS